MKHIPVTTECTPASALRARGGNEKDGGCFRTGAESGRQQTDSRADRGDSYRRVTQLLNPFDNLLRFVPDRLALTRKLIDVLVKARALIRIRWGRDT
jgi:hypothetical protein